MAHTYTLVVNNESLGPYERRMIVGMRVRKMIASDHVVWRDDGQQMNVAELMSEFEPIVLEKKECRYLHFSNPSYSWVDTNGNVYQVDAEIMGDAIKVLKADFVAVLVFFDGRVISVELPISLERELS